MSKTELIRGTNEDDISTTDKRGAKKSSESVMMKAQFVGLGSVLVATVTFAAAFTLPGGTNQDTGTPILGRKYIFKVFVIADSYAFLESFLATMNIIHSSCFGNSDKMEWWVDISLDSFRIAARSMLIALGLGLYLVLAPIGNTGAVVLAVSLCTAIFYINDLNVPLPTKWIQFERQLRRHISDGESGVKPKFISPHISRKIYFWTTISFTISMFFLLALI